MFFNFSEPKQEKIISLHNKINKKTFTSSNHFRFGVLPNAQYFPESTQKDTTITSNDKIVKIDDYHYRWFLNDQDRQINSVSQIHDITYNYEYTPIKIEDDFVDFSTFPNKEIFTKQNRENNIHKQKSSQLIIKYNDTIKENLMFPKFNYNYESFNGKQISINNLQFVQKYKDKNWFSITLDFKRDKINENDIVNVDFQESLVYLIIIKQKGRLFLYQKYFKDFDLYDSFNKNYMTKHNSKKYQFKYMDISEEIEKLKYLNKRYQDNGTNIQSMNIGNFNNTKEINFEVLRRWNLKIESHGIDISEIQTSFIATIPILNRPSSTYSTPYFTQIPMTNFLDGSDDISTDFETKRDLLINTDRRQTYDGGVF